MANLPVPTYADYRSQLLDNASLCYAVPVSQLLVTWIDTKNEFAALKTTHGYSALVATNDQADDPRILKVSKPVSSMAEGVTNLLQKLDEDVHGNVLALLKMQIEDSGGAIRAVIDRTRVQTHQSELQGHRRRERNSIESISSEEREAVSPR